MGEHQKLTLADFIRMVYQFHVKFGCVIHDRPVLLTPEEKQFRLNLTVEETTEWEDAKNDNETLDALCDRLYVLLGDVVAHGYDPDLFAAAMLRVHESNMTKLWDDGKPRYRESDGKIVKPPTFEPPELADLIDENLKHGSVYQ